MVQFKLQHRGLVRKVTFKNVDQPSWHELSWKIGDVCNIPHASVGLTYLDPDGDKITISSQPELKEYYASLDEEELESNAPHKFIVRNLAEGVPDDGAHDPREDHFLLQDAKTMAASTVGGGSQWGFNPEDEAERDPTKLRLSGYSTFADALSPLAGSTLGTEEEDETDKEDLPGGFKSEPSQPAQKNTGGSWLPTSVFSVWGKGSEPAPPPPPPPPEQPKSANPWTNENKTAAWAATSGTGKATTPTSSKPPAAPWGPPSSVATGLKRPTPNAATRPNSMMPPPVAPTIQMDSMVADRATQYAPSPAVTATIPRSKKHKKKQAAERAKEEAAQIEEMELKAMEREAAREREENARVSAEAAVRATVEEQRRVEEREWERERERLKAEDEHRRREEEQRRREPEHTRRQSDFSYSDEWQHVQEQSPDQEDEAAYRARIEAARANVFGTSPSVPQPPPPPVPPQPQARQRKSSTKGKGERSSGKSSRPNSKVYPPTPAPKKYFDSDLASESGASLNAPNASGRGASTPATPAPQTTAQVCSDVADLLGSFGRILDNERDLLDAIRETFEHKLTPGALSATFGNNLSPEMLRIVASVDDLLTRILPSRPAASPHASNMELEPRVLTPSVTPTPTIPAEPEFNVPTTEFSNSFEFANRGRPSVPVINVPRPKYPASTLTREGYSTGTTPPSQSSYYASSPYPSGSPDKSNRARSRSRPPPGDFEIVPPSYLPPQARVVPPPVVPGDETEDSPMTPDASRGFARASTHEGGMVLANQQRSDPGKADLETARQHYRSQRELYKLERAERKKEMEERAAAKAERKRAKAAANADPNIADLTNQLQGLVPPRPYEAERRYIESPFEGPRTGGPFSNPPGGTVYAEGLGQVTLVPPPGFPSAAAVTAPVSPVHEESAPSFERARRRRQSLNSGSPERYSRGPASVASRTESYHGLQPDAYGAPYGQAQPPQQDLAKRVALRLTEMGYTPQKYPALPSIVGHRIRPLTNAHGVNENELAYHIIQDLFKYTGQS